uniref:Odv-e66 n=1 Tax=Chrysodeixis includens nucleopolyhedrovirus TaxID=1207438 RepID=A0A1C8ZYQ8_9ABAC|nr:odv-e66 [Chrysodeixis includens nucleopolyhedrovirus]QGW49230.1 ODV-E66 [Chrysodeixis includens nucleopolyhedrovirus]QGW49370.1 ODV-E66 [Chrysodeixis includens nucleopolyhedrovirus]QGW49510.1 ODV-E66 [Chrysodeixis includens nucleopolyhedrovirus]QGW49790.1 ODV-E66 [Chrysodeixis includens nucleopolyhedrovirus]
MWVFLFTIIIVVIVILFVSQYLLNPSPTRAIANISSSLGNEVNRANFDLKSFEYYYVNTLQYKFLQKAEKVANPTRQFSDDGNIFVGLDPWNNVPQFGTVLHTLIGYGVRFRNPNDSLYLNRELATNLYEAMYTIVSHLPFPAPVNQAPWGIQAEWYHFSITMPEVFQNTCIVLRGFYDLDELVIKVFDEYLPLPTFALGWWRTAGNAMRMCLPYSYGQLLRGYSFAQIKAEEQVEYVLNLINFPIVVFGNGIHQDFAYFDHTDVRAYGYLINSFFTFDYYNYLFGESTVNMQNIYNSISLIGSKQGLANPAVLSRNGAHFSNVLGFFIDYQNGVISGDFSKILTIRNDRYFGSVVGQSPNIAYYEADPTNNRHAPLWTMTRKIWANGSRVIPYRTQMLGLESGILLLGNLSGEVIIPTTGPSTSSFHPAFAYTAICATENAGAMAMHARFDAIPVEYYSYTLYHRYGMFHMYERINSIRTITSNSIRCVVLTKDLTQESRWTSNSNNQVSNGVVTKHHNIANNNSNFSNFDTRLSEAINMQTVEQIISAESVNNGRGMTCFSLLVADALDQDNTTIVRVPDTNAFIITTNSSTIQCIIDFPILILKDTETREITINNATSRSLHSHELLFEDIEEPLTLASMSISDLIVPSSISKTSNSFQFQNLNGNQFKFNY